MECALALMREGEMRPEEIKARIMATFGVCRSVASEDLRRANLRIQDAIDEVTPHIGGQIKTALMRIAKKAEDTGTVRGLEVASSTLARLGKLCGLEDRSDAAKAAALSDDELSAAIAAHVEHMAIEMSDEAFAALVARRAAERCAE